MKTKVCRSLNVGSELLNDEAPTFHKQILNKAKCIDEMIELLVAKIKSVKSIKMKIQIMTLAPTIIIVHAFEK